MNEKKNSNIINTIPGKYAVILITICERWGVNRKTLLVHSPLAHLDLDAPETRISFAELNWLVQRALALTQLQTKLAAQIVADLTHSSHGFFGSAVFSSATVADAVGLLEEFMLLQSGPFYLERQQEKEVQILRLGCHETVQPALERLYAEIILGTIASIAVKLVSQAPPGIAIHFRGPRPSHEENAAQTLPCPVLYGQSENALHFPSSLLALRLKFANPVSFQFAKEQCEQSIRSLRDHHPITNRVRALLANNLRQPPDLSALAHHCHLSTRSLKRRLAESGTGYTPLLEELRKNAALSYFAEQNLQVKEVAQRLGFSSTTNFSRAFKKWTGKSPRQFLKAARG